MSPLSISTAYWTLREPRPTGDAIAEGCLRLGLRSLELDYRVSRGQLRQLRGRLGPSGLGVSSIHHPFPCPDGVPPSRADEMGPRFSSLDAEERRAAVKQAGEGLAHAEGFGAGALVLHLGDVAMDSGPDPRSLEAMARAGRRETPAYEEAKAAVLEARRAAARRHVDAVLSSLDRLASEALRRGVRLGLENRYHAEQIPDLDELDLLFRTLDGAPLAYWHDTGHAAAGAALGLLASPTEPLERFGSRLAGLHLHDAEGLDDHRAPGEGSVDFAAVAGRVPEGAALVLELHPGAGEAAARGAAGVLARAGFRFS